LGSRNILSAPVLDEDGEYFGCLSVNDLLKSLYRGKHRLLCNSCAVRSSTAVPGQLNSTDYTQFTLLVLLHPAYPAALRPALVAPSTHSVGGSISSRMPVLLLLCAAAVLAAKDPEWFEKIESISPADIIAVATEFTKQTVDKIQHGELQPLLSPAGCCMLICAIERSAVARTVCLKARVHIEAVVR
jgi:hypothetical protein